MLAEAEGRSGRHGGAHTHDGHVQGDDAAAPTGRSRRRVIMAARVWRSHVQVRCSTPKYRHHARLLGPRLLAPAAVPALVGRSRWANHSLEPRRCETGRQATSPSSTPPTLRTHTLAPPSRWCHHAVVQSQPLRAAESIHLPACLRTLDVVSPPLVYDTVRPVWHGAVSVFPLFFSPVHLLLLICTCCPVAVERPPLSYSSTRYLRVFDCASDFQHALLLRLLRASLFPSSFLCTRSLGSGRIEE